MKHRFIYLTLGVLVVLAGLWVVTNQNQDTQLILGNRKFNYEVADTDIERAKGLSERLGLANNQAMLFVFDSDGPHCMWMKDMKFPLDMVWLNEAKQVVSIKQNISPDTYPRSFCSDVPARYVVEVNAGTTQNLGIMEGYRVSF